jgi:hypothetical protein
MKPDSKFYADCGSALRSWVPWWGARRARNAVAALESRLPDPRALRLLVLAAAHRDERTRSAANSALRSLSTAAAVDALCAAWVEGREEFLGRLIQECGYVASQPLEVRVLSHLQAGKALAPATVEEVGLLVKALGEKDRRLVAGAEPALRSLSTPAAVDALCAAALRDPAGAAARVCVDQRYRPSEREAAAVFLIASGQVDVYFAEHGEDLRDLRAGYARADSAVQARVNQVAGGGDKRLLPFLRQRRRSLREAPPAERDEVVRHSIERTDWPQLFADCQELPLEHALPGWQALVGAGWVPADAGDAAMLDQIRDALRPNGATRGQPGELGPAFTPPGTSAVFERWIEAGRRQSDLARLSEPELLARLDRANPPEGMPLVAALAAGGNASAAARERVAGNAHWLIRLAGHVTGLLDAAVEDPAQEPNQWVRDVGGAGAVWRLWPEDGTPGLMQSGGGPREAALKPATGPRAIFRAVLGQRMKGGEWAIRERPASVDGGTFVPRTRTDASNAPSDPDAFA